MNNLRLMSGVRDLIWRVAETFRMTKCLMTLEKLSDKKSQAQLRISGRNMFNIFYRKITSEKEQSGLKLPPGR